MRLRLLGAHQLDNAAAAVAAAGCLRQQGFDRITLQSVAVGLGAAAATAALLPGRFQVCQLADEAAAANAAEPGAGSGGGGNNRDRGPWVVLDGAHTPESARALAAALRAAFPSEPVALVLAMAEDKAHRWVWCEGKDGLGLAWQDRAGRCGVSGWGRGVDSGPLLQGSFKCLGAP